ncbi:MAG: hypothetical protein F6J86_24865 [Symploca sp. SIO1B1]|nr:hypothetical protein [Symploca sp. SIO1B1]
MKKAKILKELLLAIAIATFSFFPFMSPALAYGNLCCPNNTISTDNEVCVSFWEPVGTIMAITNETSNVYTKVQIAKAWTEDGEDIEQIGEPQMVLPEQSIPVLFDKDKEIIQVLMTETSNPSAAVLSINCSTP